MSLRRSGAKAKPAGKGGRAGAATQRGVYVQAPQSDIYVALLGVALGAMVLGCLLLILVLNNYGFSTKVGALGRAGNSEDALALATQGVGIIETVRL